MASIQKYREKTGGKINRNSPQKKCKKGFFSCIPRDSQKKRFFPSCDRTAETAAKSAHRLLAGPREDERLDTGRCTGKCETFCVHSPPAEHGVWEAKTASRSPLPYMNTWAVNSPQQGAKHSVCVCERDRERFCWGWEVSAAGVSGGQGFRWEGWTCSHGGLNVAACANEATVWCGLFSIFKLCLSEFMKDWAWLKTLQRWLLSFKAAGKLGKRQ